MGLRDDLERFRVVGEEQRQDLEEFITHGSLGGSSEDAVKIPIKIVELPEFVYDPLDQGGVGQSDGGQPEPGDEVDVDVDDDSGDDDGHGEPGEGTDEHGYYEMDPEEFAEELDEELGLDLDPKGKKVIEETKGDFTDVSRQGPSTLLDVDELFRKGFRRKLAMDFDESYVREGLYVDGATPRDVFEWARSQNIPVSYVWLEQEADGVEETHWESFEEVEANVENRSPGQVIRDEGVDQIPFRPEDERYRHQEIVKKKQKNVVVVNIRDVSGSMGEQKREIVERTFTPMDWYLQGKYDNAEFVYIVHDSSAWEVTRGEFFGIQSGGGTRISSAYELAETILETHYPWNEWNRYIFAAGDGENVHRDTEDEVIPLMESIDANLHGYVEARPDGASLYADHADVVWEHFRDDDSVVVAQVRSNDEVTDAIYQILSTED